MHHQMLRPGTHVLRRGAGEVQVGLLPDRALVLRDVPAVRETLRWLRADPPTGQVGNRSSRPEPDPAVLAALADREALQDRRHAADVLAGDAAATAGLAALSRSLGDRVASARRARSRARVEVRRFGPPLAADRLAATLAQLLDQAGIPTDQPDSSASSAPSGDVSRVGVLVGVGEPDRGALDSWMQSGRTHALLRLVEGHAVLGPFVVPGSTACLHCVDAHLTDQDPAWPLLVEQYCSATSRAGSLPEPVDPLLSSLAFAFLARDLASYVDGRQPATWSATVTVHPELASIRTEPSLRHPACGCSWDAPGVASRTMGG